MPRFLGKAGSITNAGANIAITSWEIEAKGDVVDVTGMDSQGIKDFIAACTEWSGSFEGFATGNVAGSGPGTLVQNAVFASSATTGAPKLTGNIIITSLRVTSSVDDAVKASVSFQGTGALTYGVV